MTDIQINDNEIKQWQEGNAFMDKNKKLLQKIRNSQKRKSLSYMQSIQRKKSRPLSSPVKSFEINKSINQLRNQASSQEFRAQKINNRLKYLQTAKQRQQKLVNTARQKFYKINQIRRQSFTEKNFFSKQRQNLLFQHSKTVYFQASKIKNEKSKSTQSQKKIQIQKRSQALAVKKQSQINQIIIKQQKLKQKALKQAKAIQIQRQTQIFRQKSRSRSKQKIEQGIMNHKKDILKQYEKVQHQLKKNNLLMKSFEQRAIRIYDEKVKDEEKLLKYRQFLGLNKSQLNLKSQKQSEKKSTTKNISLHRGRQFIKAAPNKNKQFSQYLNNGNAKKRQSSQQSKQPSVHSFYLTNPQKC